MFDNLTQDELNFILNSSTKDKILHEILKNNTDEKFHLMCVDKDAYDIQYIKNPSMDIQLTAVKRCGWSIKFIEHQSEQLQLLAIGRDASSLKFIKHPTEKVQKKAIKQYFGYITNIKNPSDDIIEYTKQQKRIQEKHIQKNRLQEKERGTQHVPDYEIKTITLKVENKIVTID